MMNFLAQNIGRIEPPTGTVQVTGDPSSFVATLIRNGLTLLIITAFIVDLIWTIFAGYRFIFAGGESKNISSAWSQIYWGLIGMVVILGSFAIIKLVQTFFGVDLLTTFSIPAGSQ
ncbi:MAG: hypothetical protein UU05_C0014G0015 [Candidatus Curtissbacteria bacterium GW2011_GWA1_40_47]|uniref:Uncharacterized protein n=1 Tax=Candidatus Curtissbacteria bacterium RIFOXYA1_FULL_41_14 TaxID=1797737 RepID=A0A1F5HD77_9BACT|nr:MAG: hypothetical protein UT95_C0010G0031 [Candidatus Curtissbacteria bacterium GW2011_GWB1_40_28]KKR60605.1 MAG: hypothetical protein UT99_C0011G0013 [Candidatus Curtissbacteria bacterium GW2011_GWA2_40_31]KKR61743.1 MAG: hypothetical protein UU00_C0008G0016 [Microgenomates group bacterium GW2011_GWC1_40_35]KKR65600.1 MAG: hypothetical protein UU05_C0014G0015 [Candidatus Curtissbacteria bacterium GW2011_GWA1_40_47]OGE02002.1 MAG: hypothetical protein A2196_03880 [Candidatus Curtissbacteria 